MASKFETSKSTGQHAWLNKLVGSWTGVAKVWLDPEKDPDESTVTGHMRPIFGGRFIMHEYTGSFQGKPLEGIAIYGYHLGLEKFDCVWIDSFHTGTDMLISEGKRKEDGFSVLGSYAYVTPETEQHWGWRTEIEIVSDDEIRIRAFNISPDGKEEPATETNYNRVK